MIFEHRGHEWEGYTWWQWSRKYKKKIRVVGVRIHRAFTNEEDFFKYINSPPVRDFQLALEKWKRIVKKRDQARLKI